MVGNTPKPMSLPLEHDDYPELDSAEEKYDEEIKKYQSMIGALRWVPS